MKNLIWRLLAKLLARPAVADWLIARAQRTPYQHIMSADSTEMYMGRWWLFNPYDRVTHKGKLAWFPWSIRIHHIKRPDADRALHDHPWNARTVILQGWYVEQREFWTPDRYEPYFIDQRQGNTSELLHDDYHRIDEVSPGGVWTLFITSRWIADWGFRVDGRKVDWRTYTGEQP